MGTLTFKAGQLEDHHIKSSPLTLSCVASETAFNFLVSAQDSAEGYSAVGNTYDKRARLFENPFRHFEGIIRKHPVLFRPFEKVVIGVRGVPFTLVPESSDKDPREILASQTNISPEDAILVNTIGQTGSALVSAVPQRFIDEAGLFYSDAHIVHLAYANAFSAVEASDCLVFSIGDKWMEVAHAIEGSPVFANQYRITSLSDALYFLASVVRQFSIDLTTCKVDFGGQKIDGEAREYLIRTLGIEPSCVRPRTPEESLLFALQKLSECE